MPSYDVNHLQHMKRAKLQRLCSEHGLCKGDTELTHVSTQTMRDRLASHFTSMMQTNQQPLPYSVKDAVRAGRNAATVTNVVDVVRRKLCAKSYLAGGTDLMRVFASFDQARGWICL